jgi:hypothetical protein
MKMLSKKFAVYLHNYQLSDTHTQDLALTTGRLNNSLTHKLVLCNRAYVKHDGKAFSIMATPSFHGKARYEDVLIAMPPLPTRPKDVVEYYFGQVCVLDQTAS